MGAYKDTVTELGIIASYIVVRIERYLTELLDEQVTKENAEEHINKILSTHRWLKTVAQAVDASIVELENGEDPLDKIIKVVVED